MSKDNVGVGNPISVIIVASTLVEDINPQIKPVINNQFRLGDIRHCVSDISKIYSKLDFSPKYTFDEGMKELIKWVKLQESKIEDKSLVAFNELKDKGLMK